MVDEIEYIRQVVACFYSFKCAHILIGGMNDKNQLQVHTEVVKSNCPIKEIAKLLNSYSYNIWINTHEPLRTAIGGRCIGELSFDKANESENEALEDLFLSLKQSGGLAVAVDVKIQGSNGHNCLKILLKALTPQLCRRELPEEIYIEDEYREERSIYQILRHY